MRAALRACASAWLPMTSSGRSAARERRRGARHAPSPGARAPAPRARAAANGRSAAGEHPIRMAVEIPAQQPVGDATCPCRPPRRTTGGCSPRRRAGRPGTRRTPAPARRRAPPRTPRSTAGPRSRTRRTCLTSFTCGAISGRWSMSCSAPRPCSAVGAAPPISTHRRLRELRVLERGDRVGEARARRSPRRRPACPVRRATASAANTAVASSRMSTMRMPRALAATRIGEMCPPQSVNTKRTPCAASAAATRSPPCAGIGRHVMQCLAREPLAACSCTSAR